jgi:hypothetical protein
MPRQRIARANRESRRDARTRITTAATTGSHVHGQTAGRTASGERRRNRGGRDGVLGSDFAHLSTHLGELSVVEPCSLLEEEGECHVEAFSAGNVN